MEDERTGRAAPGFIPPPSSFILTSRIRVHPLIRGSLRRLRGRSRARGRGTSRWPAVIVTICGHVDAPDRYRRADAAEPGRARGGPDARPIPVRERRAPLARGAGADPALPER